MLFIRKLLRITLLLLTHHIYCADTTTKPQKITTIIFNLDGVLFQHNKTAFAQKIGIGKVTKYTLLNWTTPDTTCLHALDVISSQEPDQPTIPLIHRNKKMPCCIVDWQLGNTSHTQARAALRQQIEKLADNNHFKNVQEKELIQKILDISMDPQHLNDIVKPMTAMIELAKELKKRNYKLIILSNLAQEQYDLLQRTHSDITHLFDDIIASCQVKILKPDIGIYKHLLDKHTLQGHECVCIDNQKENIEGAQKIGMHGVWHKNIRSTRMSLEKLGV